MIAPTYAIVLCPKESIASIARTSPLAQGQGRNGSATSLQMHRHTYLHFRHTSESAALVLWDTCCSYMVLPVLMFDKNLSRDMSRIYIHVWSSFFQSTTLNNRSPTYTSFTHRALHFILTAWTLLASPRTFSLQLRYRPASASAVVHCPTRGVIKPRLEQPLARSSVL